MMVWASCDEVIFCSVVDLVTIERRAVKVNSVCVSVYLSVHF